MKGMINMKKIAIMVIICCLLTLFGACGNKEESSSSETESVSSQTSSQTVSGEPPFEVVLGKGGVYRNDDLGFELTFPETWKDLYIVFPYEEDCITICFYGKGEYSRDYDADVKNFSIPILYICTEEYLISQGGGVCNVSELGESKGVLLYSFQQTDCPWYVDPEYDYTGKYTDEEWQDKLWDADKAQEFVDQLPELLKTFKAIET